MIDPSTTELTPMARPAAEIGSRQVTMLVDAHAGFDKPVPLTVTTVVEGDRAESLRQTLDGNSPDEIEKQFLNYYASYYSDIRSGGRMTVSDEADKNRVTTTEHYLIENMSKWYESEQQYAVNLHAPDIDDLVTDPSTPIRTAPLALSHPMDVSVRTEVLLPRDWPIKPESSKVEAPAFLLERNIDLSERKLIIRDRFRTRLDEISAADTPSYVANLKRARAELGYSLWWTKEKTEAPAAKPRWIDRLNWPVALLGLSVLALCLVGARRLYRYDPEPRIDPRHANLNGIRGWLWFPALATVIGPLVILHTLYTGAGAYTTDTWVKLTTFGQAAYHPAWAPALLVEFIGNLVLLVFALLILVLFSQRRSSVPRLFVALMLLRSAVVIAATVLSAKIPAVGKSTPQEAFAFVGVLFSSALWIAYFLASHRVRATFVRRLAPVASPAVDETQPEPANPESASPEPAIPERASDPTG